MESENKTTEQTPMGRVWAYVIASMLLTATCAYGVHAYIMNTIKKADATEIANAEANLHALTVYRDELIKAHAVTGSPRSN